MKQHSMKLETAAPTTKTLSASHLISAPYISVMKSAPKPSKAFDTYWRFTYLRQAAFFEKIQNPNTMNWSEDRVLKKHRFTNAYRASDRVSQYLIKDVQYNQKWSFEDTVFRTLLFKIFNKIDTWEILENKLGELSWRNGITNEISHILDREFSKGTVIYSAAYIMPSSKSTFGHDRKHQNHLDLINYVMQDKFLNSLNGANSLESLFHQLKSLSGIGPFLAYQYAIDLNYSEYFNFSENDFVQAGPGALDGIKKCFDNIEDYTPSDIIKIMVDIQDSAFEQLELPFQNLWGRALHLIDCQNLFCETDKYCRVVHPEIIVGAGRSRIKQTYRPSSKPQQFVFPPKWNISF